MTLTILSLEDEADVRDALERDLEEFWDKIRLEVAEDVDDAWAVIDEIVEDGDELALVLSDHRLPGKSGVDFLVDSCRMIVSPRPERCWSPVRPTSPIRSARLTMRPGLLHR